MFLKQVSFLLCDIGGAIWSQGSCIFLLSEEQKNTRILKITGSFLEEDQRYGWPKGTEDYSGLQVVYLGGGFTTWFIFTPIPGEMIQVDEHILNVYLGSFNHQLVPYSLPKSSKCFLRRCLDPLEAFSWGVWGVQTTILTRCLKDYGLILMHTYNLYNL